MNDPSGLLAKPANSGANGNKSTGNGNGGTATTGSLNGGSGNEGNGNSGNSSPSSGNGNGNGIGGSSQSGIYSDVQAILVRQGAPPISLRVTASDNQGRSLEVAVPWDTDIQLLVISKALSLGDQNKNPSGNQGFKTTVHHSSTDASTTHPVTVQVLGVHWVCNCFRFPLK
jgi:hypothetical protein